MSFLGEIKRRKVFQIAAVYAVVAWLLVQIVATVEAPLNLPDWVDTFVILLLAIGFPITLIISWAFNVTPEGLVRDRGAGVQTNGRTIEYVFIGLLVIAVGWLVYRDFSPSIDQTMGSDDVLPNSVAVLPFENLSPNPDDAFFADGLHEEVLNQLVKLSNLNVISRTTMLRYAGRDKSPPEIADELHVESVMEGSVRYAGDRIRVTIQLIDPETDLHLLSETYNADVSDIARIFDIQSDIAMNVANALQAEFSSGEQARIEQIPTTSSDAYSLYLAAKAFQERWTRDDFLLAFERIDRALSFDPNFALAWSTKARLYADAIPFFPERAPEYLETADDAIERALETGSAVPEVHAQAAMVSSASGDWLQAGAELDTAQRLGMSSIEATQYGFRIATGHAADSLASVRDWLEHDPLNSTVSFWLISMLDAVGDTEGALMEYQRGSNVFGEEWAGHFNAFVTLLGSAEHDRAKTIAQRLLANPVISKILPDFDNPDDARLILKALYSDDTYADYRGRSTISVLAAYFGDEPLSLEAMDGALDAFAASPYLWRPLLAEVRQQDGFKTLMREHGFVDYWREYGWPDFCEPSGASDFECR
jgi:TolB-like protein